MAKNCIANEGKHRNGEPRGVQTRDGSVCLFCPAIDCLKMSSVSNRLSVVMATSPASYSYHPVPPYFSCARFQRERESTLIVAFFNRLFSPLHRTLPSSVLFLFFKNAFYVFQTLTYTLSRDYQKRPDVRPSSVHPSALPWA